MSKRSLLLIYVAVVMAVAACATGDKPAGIMDPDEIVPVLADLEVVYAGVDQTVKDPKQRAKKYAELNALVLKKYELSQEEFYTSYQWYESNPTKLDTVFKQVATKLNQDLQDLQAAESGRPRPKGPDQK